MSSPTAVLLFGDGSIDIRSWLEQILHSYQEGSLISKFIGETTVILRNEVQMVKNRDEMPIAAFTTFHNLCQQAQTESLHPALHAACVVFVQLATFIRAYEQHAAETFPDGRSPCLGFCLGEISAATISASNNLLHVMSAAPIAVQVAFRVGMLAAQVRSAIEEECTAEESWSIAVDKSCALDEQQLQIFHDKMINNPSRRAWISFYARKTVSVSGPPSTLRLLISWLKEQGRLRHEAFTPRIQIRAPYHAPHLYSRETIHRSLEDLEISFFSGFKRPLLGSSIGKYSTVPAETGTHAEYLFGDIVESILMKPMSWSKTCEALSDVISNEDSPVQQIRPFGPNSISQHLVSALGAKVSIGIDEAFGSNFKDQRQAKNVPLAVVGMAMRLPHATNVEELWEALCDGYDAHQTVPADRFNPETHLEGPAFGCFIDQVGHFDAKFFNMSPREATQTDPGHRLGMITALEAMENAGMVVGRTPSTESSRIGTFYGQTVDEYKQQNMALNVDTYYIPGSLRAFAPGRLNYFFKFGGPAYAIDTACSSGAVALNLACKSIWSGECDTALAGGINTLCGCDNFNGLLSGRFLSSTGGCKTLDNDADGYCRAEAVCSLVIKRLDAAVADNDNVLGLISGTVTNFATDAVSITRPHGPTQESLYRSVLHEAGIQPADIDYVELHGTGTQAGDQVETKSVMDVFAPVDSNLSRTLYLSAVKPNLGHSEAASGPTSLIKALKVFKEQKFPPHIGIKSEINKSLPYLAARGVCVPKEIIDYPKSTRGPRRAVVSNFSAAGGCTAFIVEEASKQIRVPQKDPRTEQAVCFSAKTKPSLASNIKRFAEWIDAHPESDLSDISYSTSARRAHYSLRKTFIASTLPDLRRQLDEVELETISPIKKRKVVFAFTGQGSLYQSSGKGFFETCSIFREAILQFDDIGTGFGFPSFLPLITDPNMRVESARPAQSNLCIVAIEMALLRLWTSWGVSNPTAVIGHSLGEYTALYAAKVISARDTLYLVGQRGMLLESQCTAGTHAMLAVKASLNQLQNYLEDMGDSFDVACINSPKDTVLSGASNIISQIAASLKDRDIKCTKLNLPYGFHSAQVDPILQPFESIADTVEFRKPVIPVASSMLGEIITAQGIFNGSYLRKQCRQTVNFTDALHALENDNDIDSEGVWIEIGPQPLCTGMANATLGVNFTSLYSMNKGGDTWASLCKAASAAHDIGVPINWQRFHSDFEKSLSLLELPTYAFELKKYWIDYNDFLLQRQTPIANKQSQEVLEPKPWTTSLNKMTSCKSSKGIVDMSFETDLSEEKIHAAITGHLVNGAGLCPASIYGDVALTIGNFVRESYPCKGATDGMDIADMSIVKPIVVTKAKMEQPMIMKVSAKAILDEGRIEIGFALANDNTARATCSLKFGDSGKWRSRWARTNYLSRRGISSLNAGVDSGTTHKFFQGMAYKLFSSVVDYDSKYQGMHEVMMDSRELEAAAVLRLYDGKEGGTYYCSPFWIDAIIHIAGFVMNANETLDSEKGVFISGGWESIRLAENIDPEKEYKVYVKMIPISSSLVAGDVVLLCGDETVGMLENLKFQRIPRQLLHNMLAPSNQSNKEPRLNHQPGGLNPPVLQTENLKRKSISQSLKKPIQAHTDQSKTILKIIADEIGIEQSELTDDAEFAHLGVDSLLTLTILTKIREALGIDLADDIFMECGNVLELKNAIDTSAVTSTIGSTDSANSSDTEATSPNKTPRLKSPFPADGMLMSIRKIVAEQIGVDEDELTAERDFSKFGVDSLMCLSISAALQSELNIKISAEWVASKFSMEAIEEELLGSKPSQPKDAWEVCGSQKSTIDFLPLKYKSPSRTPTLLQRGSGSTVLFMFPDGGGSAAVYSGIPTIDPEVNIWGLSRSKKVSSSESVESLVGHWLLQVQEVQPSGPYNFCGWSAGGFFALEATRQILKQGGRVDKLILVDSPCPSRHEPMPLTLLERLFNSGIIGGNLPTSQSKALETIRRSFTDTISALANYQPQPLDKTRYCLPETSIIWANDGVGKFLTSEDLNDLQDGSRIAEFLLEQRNDKNPGGWEMLIPGEISTAFIHGHHFNIVQPPHCVELGLLIGQVLDGKRDRRWEWV